MASSTAKNLEAIVNAVKQHDSNCKEKGKAVALSPYEHERLGFDSVPVDGRSVPVIVDDTLGTGRFRVLCDGYHGPKKDEEVEDVIEAPSQEDRELVPAGAPGPSEREGTIFGKMTLEEYRMAFEGDEFHRIPKTLWEKLAGEGFRELGYTRSGVVMISGVRSGKTMTHERFRRWVGEWHPEIAIEEIRPGVVTYKFPPE